MDSQLLITALNVVATPLLVLLTLWAKARLSTSDRRARREDDYLVALVKRVDMLEREIKEVRIELKNRDAEYIKLYQEHTTLKARYEVLQSDYNQTVRELHDTQKELTALKEDIKNKAALAATEMQKL